MQEHRIYQYYVPVALWITKELRKHRANGSK